MVGKLLSFDIGEKNFAYSVGDDMTLVDCRRVNVVHRSGQTVIESCIEISKILETIDVSDVDDVLIEQQLGKNVRAQKICQHVWTWFHVRHGKDPVMIPSTWKTRYLDAPKDMSNRERKKWSSDTFESMLIDRQDLAHLDYVRGLVKRDDVADSYLQLVAYVRKTQRSRNNGK